jgi:hypothetical protein
VVLKKWLLNAVKSNGAVSRWRCASASTDPQNAGGLAGRP